MTAAKTASVVKRRVKKTSFQVGDRVVRNKAVGGRKSWSFGLTPDEEHKDYEPYRTLTGYVHADGTVEGLY